MAKFNTKAKTGSTKTVNRAGGQAYKMSDKLAIVSILLTSFLKDQFYRTEKETTATIKNLVTSMPDKKFIAKAAVYARNVFGMRSVTHLTAAELAANVKGESWLRKFINSVVRRVDDMSEILAYYIANYGDLNFKKRLTKMPNALRRGLADAFSKFTAYHLAKYKMESRGVSLIDLVNLVHPRPTEKNAEALKALVKGTLGPADTWESALSKAGQIAEDDDSLADLKSTAWVKLLSEDKLGYLAALRNVRNIVSQSQAAIPLLCKLLTNEVAIKKSLVFPYQITKAQEALLEADLEHRQVLAALNTALELTCKNIPVFTGKTLICLDDSGSMGDLNYSKSPFSMGSLFAAMLYKSDNDCELMMFSDDARIIRGLNPLDSILTIRARINEHRTGNGTNFRAPLIRASKEYDRMIFLSDGQGWIGYNTPVGDLRKYETAYNCKPYIYSWDLAGYEDMQFPENRIIALAGFSDKIFDLMRNAETDKNVMLNAIEGIEL